MLRIMCKGKLHRVTVTESNMNYVGSITIDQDLLEAADIYPFEQVEVVNVTTGARLETYVISGERGSGVICLNGAAAHHFSVGDIAIVMSYVHCTEDEIGQLQVNVVFVDDHNKITHTQQIPVAKQLSGSMHI